MRPEGRLRSAGPMRVGDRPGIGGSKFSAHLVHNEMRGGRGVVGDDTLEERGGDEQRHQGGADRRSREHRFGSIEVKRRRGRGWPPCELRLCGSARRKRWTLTRKIRLIPSTFARTEARAYTARSKPSPGFLDSETGLLEARDPQQVWPCARVPILGVTIPGRARPPWPSRTSSRR